MTDMFVKCYKEYSARVSRPSIKIFIDSYYYVYHIIMLYHIIYHYYVLKNSLSEDIFYGF